jgi:hypothetical protein
MNRSDDWDVSELARAEVRFARRDFDENPPFATLQWYRRPGLLFSAAAVAFVVASIGLVITLMRDDVATVPAGSTITATSSPTAQAPLPAPPAPVETPQPVQTVVIQQAPRRQSPQQLPGTRVMVPSAPPPPPVTVTSTVTSVVPTTSIVTSAAKPDPGGGPQCGVNVPKDDCMVDPPVIDPSELPGKGDPGGSSTGGSGSSIPKCDDLPADTLC